MDGRQRICYNSSYMANVRNSFFLFPTFCAYAAIYQKVIRYGRACSYDRNIIQVSKLLIYKLLTQEYADYGLPRALNIPIYVQTTTIPMLSKTLKLANNVKHVLFFQGIKAGCTPKELYIHITYFIPGKMQCGPVSLKSIKEGFTKHLFDAPFVFAEVNGDRVTWGKSRRKKDPEMLRVETSLWVHDLVVFLQTYMQMTHLAAMLYSNMVCCVVIFTLCTNDSKSIQPPHFIYHCRSCYPDLVYMHNYNETSII